MPGTRPGMTELGQFLACTAAALGYSLIFIQWICNSREGISPSAVRICTDRVRSADLPAAVRDSQENTVEADLA